MVHNNYLHLQQYSCTVFFVVLGMNTTTSAVGHHLQDACDKIHRKPRIQNGGVTVLSLSYTRAGKSVLLESLD